MIIGLTGGTGSGKSTAATFIEKKGYRLVDADKLSRDVTKNGSPVLKDLAEVFGFDILRPDGSLDRQTLGRRAFSSDENTAKLNAIVTSEVIKLIKEEASKGDDIVVDAPTLFENHLESIMDKIIVVTADKDVRIKRLQLRDGLSRHDCLNIMAKQMPEEEKISKADFVIYNNSDENDLETAVNDALCAIIER